MKRALQFGAGNIGRGFMAQLFWEAGYRTVFVEAKTSLVDMLNQEKEYTLRLLDGYTQKEVDLRIDRIEAVAADDREHVAEMVSEAAVMGTAVGVKNLEHIAEPLARGLELRHCKNETSVDIYLCENVRNVHTILRKAVMDSLQADAREWVEHRVGFVRTSVARMVPVRSKAETARNPLMVVADSYHHLPCDAGALRAELPPVRGLEPVEDFNAEFDRKIFTHNLGHAALGYLGYLKGCHYIHQGFDDDFIVGIFNGALEETTRALLKTYPCLTYEGHKQILQDVNVRFKNPLIKDTVYRVCRDPVRKLGPQDRLIGSARLCISHEVEIDNIAVVCGAALCYDYPQGPEALRLQKMIKERGIEAAVRDVCGEAPEGSIGKKIMDAYFRIRDKFRD